jgi:ABC-type glycerol-3-phosphate transport system permease component
MVVGKKTQKLLQKIIIYILTFIVCAVAIIPFLWMVSTSFKTSSEIYSYPPVWIPRSPTLHGYLMLANSKIFSNAGFIQFAENSLFVATSTAVVSVIMAALAAYSMSRFRFRGSDFLRYTILLSQMLPGALLLIPLYLIVNSLHLLDTDWSLILAYISFSLPYSAYILKGYFDSIPPDLDEAAMVDGCTRVGALFRVIFPLAGPGIVVTFVSAFILGWNEFMFALTFLNSYSKWTLPLALGTFQGQYLVDWGFLFAGSTIVTLPVLILFLILQRWLAAGFVSGAVKA